MDEVQRLVMEVVNKDKVDQLVTALQAQKTTLAGLAADLRTGAIAQAQFEQAAVAAAGQIVYLNDQIKELSGRGGIGGGGILQASYAVQDFTSVLSGGGGLARALSSVQNNIPGLLMSLGATGGLAGVVSLVSLGIGALLPLIEKLWGSLKDEAPWASSRPCCRAPDGPPCPRRHPARRIGRSRRSGRRGRIAGLGRRRRLRVHPIVMTRSSAGSTQPVAVRRSACAAGSFGRLVDRTGARRRHRSK